LSTAIDDEEFPSDPTEFHGDPVSALAAVVQTLSEIEKNYAFRSTGERWPRLRTGERVKITGIKRRLIFERDGHSCRSCGLHLLYAEVEIDHIIPWSAYGSDWSCNLRVILAIRQPKPWGLHSADVHAEWEAAATAAVAAYIELNGADPVDARAVIAEALAPQPYDVTWLTGLAAREPDAAGGLREALAAKVSGWRDHAADMATGTRDEMTEGHAVGECAKELAAILDEHPGPQPAPELAPRPGEALAADNARLRAIITEVLGWFGDNGSGRYARVSGTVLARAYAKSPGVAVPEELRRYL